ncbi:MAG: hypothetical protein WBY44_20570 [Bryobacteraceae bacterium]
MRPGNVVLVLLCAAAIDGSYLKAQPVAVRQTEGAVHGFLTLSSLDGDLVANGDLEQVARGSRVTSRLIFHFKDGSLQDETTVFSQSGHFRLLSDHLVQKGAAFKRQMDLSVNGSTGVATARYSDDHGKEKVETVRLTLPPDVANGMVPVLLKNLATGQSLTASMVVAAPKPQLVKLAINPIGEDPVSIGERRKATRYVVKIEIGGIKGAIAPLVGKQPPDTYVWILRESAPAFLKSEGPACEGCDVLRTQLASPVWPKASDSSADRKK